MLDLAEGFAHICREGLEETILKDLIIGLIFSVVLVIAQNKQHHEQYSKINPLGVSHVNLSNTCQDFFTVTISGPPA